MVGLEEREEQLALSTIKSIVERDKEKHRQAVVEEMRTNLSRFLKSRKGQ